MLIAIDHGNKQIKTVHTQPFTSGLIQGDTPGFGTDCLAYQGKYYTLTDRRIPYRRDKTEDERFFILTLFAIAYEIEAMGRYSDTLMRVQLAVGLPPAHFGVQAKRFINYFDGRGAISFQFRGKPYAVYIENTACFPQSFSAAVATVKNLTASPKVLVVDIGGFTADYVRLRNGVPDMSACDSLENGVILLYNRVRARANAELDVLLDESEICHNIQNMENELLENLGRLHTTELGVIRIKKNLSLNVENVIEWCKEKISLSNAEITRKGKNWYITIDNCIITVNAYSYTVITAHKVK